MGAESGRRRELSRRERAHLSRREPLKASSGGSYRCSRGEDLEGPVRDAQGPQEKAFGGDRVFGRKEGDDEEVDEGGMGMVMKRKRKRERERRWWVKYPGSSPRLNLNTNGKTSDA